MDAFINFIPVGIVYAIGALPIWLTAVSYGVDFIRRAFRPVRNTEATPAVASISDRRNVPLSATLEAA